MKALALLVLTALAAFAAWLVLRGFVPAPVLLAWTAGAVSLGWLVLLVTLPWNLHFQARALLVEMATARARGIAVPAAREAEAARIARRMLRVSVAAHVLSAAVMAVAARVSGARAGYWFAAFCLASTAVRPAFEYFRHLRRRLARMMGEVSFPYDDVVALRERLDALAADARIAREQLESLGDRVARGEERAAQRADESERRLALLVRRFDETIDRLTDNQEVIAGIKAFVRLVRDGEGGAAR